MKYAKLESTKLEVAHVARQINLIQQRRQLAPKVEMSFKGLVI